MGLTDVPSIQAEYPTSTRHFLLIGFLGMFVGSIVFCYLAMKKKGNNITQTVTFIIASVAAGAYYSMWSGYGVTKKVEAEGPQRFIFWGRYVDWLITTPLLLYDIAVVVDAELGEIVMLLGVDVLMIVSGYIGASVLHPYKWAWWTLGMFFFGIVMYMFVGFYSKCRETKPDVADKYKILLALTIVSWCVYPIMWVIGSEGLAAVSLDIEVGFICLADLVAKVGFGLYLLFAVLPTEEEGEAAEKTSLV
uniref:Rhodopsin n=1 Tax=Hemiselmis andersenii TaxID=464988 RepID=A0A6T8IZ18_HEMAN|mmetsp:Transcript_11624/g.26960  ORF Transcript_11624/g.26960 Transcript_11624/m.26960 type:complete len:249 (+) Transcript_11624:16-762(+)